MSHIMTTTISGCCQNITFSFWVNIILANKRKIITKKIRNSYFTDVFMNDMFLFMKSCNFYNYADDNFVSRSSPDVNVILYNLKSDCQISLKWFDDNGMKANPSKFKFMIMSSENIEPQIFTISDDVCLQSQTDVKVLGITVDYWLTFNEHIRICTLRVARQFNALSRISKYLDTISKSVLYHSFIASNFKYCPIVWHFCGVVNNNNLEKIQERSLRILFSDYESDVHDLLDSIGGQTLALRRLKFMLLEVYKCIKKVNAPCLHNLFNTNTIPYQLKAGTAIAQNNEVWAEIIFLCWIPSMEFCFKWP